MCYQVLGRTAVKRVCGLTLVFALLAVHRASQVVNLGGRFKLRKISSSPSNAVDASPLAFVLWRALDSGYNPYGNIQGTRCGSKWNRNSGWDTRFVRLILLPYSSYVVSALFAAFFKHFYYL